MNTMNPPKIMVFRPTMEEFKNFSRYIQYMESQGAHFAGVAKVIPPKEWVPRQTYDNIDNFVIPAPIEQVVSGQKGLYTQYNIQKKPLTVKEFRQLTNTVRYEPPFHESYDELERIYWKNITFNSAIYGADISGSLYDKDVNEWNIARLNTLLDVIENDSGVKIEGVNTAYLYFGMWKTTFAWHTEDMDLYSINYVHFGAPKSWYAIPPEHGKRLERLAAGFYPNDKNNCSSFLRHKMTLISPSILRQYGIPVNKITQEAGEFMITFPYGYHAGFNHGFNCAESTNFASERWINYGKAAVKCTCRNDTVMIDMDIFVQHFQPDQYEDWKCRKQEFRVCFDEIPYPPDMLEPYRSWKEKIDDYKKLCDITEVIKKFAKTRKTKTTSKSKTTPRRCSPKSSNTSKKTKSLSPKKLRVSVKKLALEDTTSTSPSDCDVMVPEITFMSEIDLPGSSGSSMVGSSLFDRVKEGGRRKSSAKTLSSEECIEKGLKKSPFTKKLESNKTTKKKLKVTKKSKSKINPPPCSVKCEPLDSLPYQVINKKPFVVKETKSPSRPPLKRRHPVNEKSSKKTCSNVLVKCAHSNEQSDDHSQTSFSTTISEESSTLDTEDPISFQEESEYNQTVANYPPYCAICSLFQPYFKNPLSDLTTKRGLPSRMPSFTAKPKHVAGDETSPLISEVSFASNLNTPSPLAECQLLDAKGRSTLIRCKECQVQVHSSCYGVKMLPEDLTRWLCDRCVESSRSARCCLCCMRGGALKKTSCGKLWSHVVCAIALPEVFFDETVTRSGINLSKLPAKRFKLRCFYGSQSEDCFGVCLQCCSSRCTVSFHTTCALAAGLLIEPGNWPLSVFAHCHKHTILRTKGKEDTHLPEVDSYVIAKHKNGKYYHARVTKLKKESFYKANFKDNSWSDNLYAEDIVSHDWSSGELPVMGSAIEVKWTDGKIYDAEYRGHSKQESIRVEFDDGLLIDFERNEIFTSDDPIPSKIKRKLRTQHATPLKQVESD